MASDGHSLRLYQAVIEAKKLLSELSNPEISVSDPTGFLISAGYSQCSNNYILFAPITTYHSLPFGSEQSQWGNKVLLICSLTSSLVSALNDSVEKLPIPVR